MGKKKKTGLKCGKPENEPAKLLEQCSCPVCQRGLKAFAISQGGFPQSFSCSYCCETYPAERVLGEHYVVLGQRLFLSRDPGAEPCVPLESFLSGLPAAAGN